MVRVKSPRKEDLLSMSRYRLFGRLQLFTITDHETKLTIIGLWMVGAGLEII